MSNYKKANILEFNILNVYIIFVKIIKILQFLISLGVRISRFHREDRGSSPRWGKFFLLIRILFLIVIKYWLNV